MSLYFYCVPAGIDNAISQLVIKADEAVDVVSNDINERTEGEREENRVRQFLDEMSAPRLFEEVPESVVAVNRQHIVATVSHSVRGVVELLNEAEVYRIRQVMVDESLANVEKTLA